jgi:hypothetical protein
MQKYRIIVPSRRRVTNAKRILSLVPSATIYVDERERKSYAPVVPSGQLKTHRPTTNLPQVRNLLLDTFTEPVIVQLDDDFVGVACQHRRHGRIEKAPDVILDVIENGIQVAEDLDVGLYGWSATMNPMVYFPGDPISFTAPIFSCFITRGSARHRYYDEAVACREDIDITLRSLLRDRIVVADRRFHFHCGEVFSGAGGTVDITSAAQYKKTTQTLVSRWGAYMSASKPSNAVGNKAKRFTKDGVSIRVRRRSHLASAH